MVDDKFTEKDVQISTGEWVEYSRIRQVIKFTGDGDCVRGFGWLVLMDKTQTRIGMLRVDYDQFDEIYARLVKKINTEQ